MGACAPPGGAVGADRVAAPQTAPQMAPQMAVAGLTRCYMKQLPPHWAARQQAGGGGGSGRRRSAAQAAAARPRRALLAALAVCVGAGWAAAGPLERALRWLPGCPKADPLRPAAPACREGSRAGGRAVSKARAAAYSGGGCAGGSPGPAQPAARVLVRTGSGRRTRWPARASDEAPNPATRLARSQGPAHLPEPVLSLECSAAPPAEELA